MDIKILMSGDQAVSVQMGSEISLEVNRKVIMLLEAIKKSPIPGVREMVPTYASLMIHYDPSVISLLKLEEEIMNRAENMSDIGETKKIIREVPILYGGELGPDLELWKAPPWRKSFANTLPTIITFICLASPPAIPTPQDLRSLSPSRDGTLPE